MIISGNFTSSGRIYEFKFRFPFRLNYCSKIRVRLLLFAKKNLKILRNPSTHLFFYRRPSENFFFFLKFLEEFLKSKNSLAKILTPLITLVSEAKSRYIPFWKIFKVKSFDISDVDSVIVHR